MTSAFDIYCELDGTLDGFVECDERMSRHTTYRIGGPAALFVECATVSDLSRTFQVLNSHQMPWAVIGKGSNLLVADKGCQCAIITLGSEFKKYSFGDDGLLVSGAGVLLSRLVQEAFRNGSTGLEFAVGIPGTLGGALFMNAGMRDDWIGSRVESVTVFRPGTGLERYSGGDFNWQYRSSGIPRGSVIVEAQLRVKPGDMSQIRSRMEGNLARRKKKQPLSQPSAGSVFRNPEGDSAGRLIEEAGLKGVTEGGAQISTQHANFIVNTGDAKAADVMSLIILARRRVREAHGIELEPEIQFLGF